MGKSSRNGGCSVTIFDYQRVVGPTSNKHLYIYVDIMYIDDLNIYIYYQALIADSR